MNAGALLQRHRGRIMGYAALMIIVYHCFFSTGSAFGDFFAGKNNKMGVDLFVFLSGFGLALSLSKSTGFIPYYRRRLRRLLPSYYVILVCMLPFMSLSLGSLLIAVVPVSVWFGNETLWYVSASLGYYLLVPVLFRIFTGTRFPRIAMWLLTALFALAVPAALSFMNAEIALMRIPALVVGVAFGVLFIRCNENRSLDLAMLGILAVLGIVTGAARLGFGLLSKREISFLSKNLCAPALAMLLAAVFELIDGSPVKKIAAVFEEIGKYSLEMYFAHLCIKVVLGKFIELPPAALLVVLLAASYPAARVIHAVGLKATGMIDRGIRHIVRKTA